MAEGGAEIERPVKNVSENADDIRVRHQTARSNYDPGAGGGGTGAAQAFARSTVSPTVSLAVIGSHGYPFSAK